MFQYHTGRALCFECFERDLLKRVRESLEQFGVRSSDRILLAVSGGKDSLAMIYLLSKVHPLDRMFAITVVEGVEGYERSHEIKVSAKIASEVGIEYEVVKAKDVIGFSVKDLVEASSRKSIDVSPCTFCGVIRRRVINVYARSRGFTKVATAHTLNDEVQTALLNILRGDTMRLIQWHPRSIPHSPLLIKRVKPLRRIYEYEIAAYAYLKGIPLQSEQCPYLLSRPTVRARLKPMMLEYEQTSPGSLMKFLDLLDDALKPLVEKVNRSNIALPVCEKCGEPTAPGRRLCRVCEFIKSLGLG